MPESSVILNDLNKVFIPCRTVLEMEALTSLLLEHFNYEMIREIPKSQPTSQSLIKVFKVVDVEPLERIIEYFIDVVVNRLKPIVMYERDHHDRFRMGNVVAYTKTRMCLYLALHRLKLKFLIIKDFMDKFKENKFQLNENQNEGYRTFLSTFHKEYTEKNTMNLKLMLSTKRVSERVSELLDTKDTITNDDIIQALTFKKYLDDKNRIKFIMREILAKIDVQNPFSIARETMIDTEDIMISQDFIPELIPAISKCLSENQRDQLTDCFKAYEFMINSVLEGINYAIKIASGGQIDLDLDGTIYNTGNIFNF
jgi:hypothetical protein